MSYRQIGSADPRYLAATDILIGDMSDINYEFLVFDRPIILLVNTWLRTNFPDVGIKTDLSCLDEAIKKSIYAPEEYKKQRHDWLEKALFRPDGQSSKRCINIMVEQSKINEPMFLFIHGNDVVRKSNLEPLYEQAKSQGFSTYFISYVKKNQGRKNGIYVAAHVEDLNISEGYKVHFDHAPKGKGTANVEASKKSYIANSYFPSIDLHITAGQLGQERTKMLLGPYSNRAFIGGYPKADFLLKYNTEENKRWVYKQLGFEANKPLITYAPAGKESYMKPGGSLNKEVLKKLKKLSKSEKYNVLIKFKNPKIQIIFRLFLKINQLID